MSSNGADDAVALDGAALMQAAGRMLTRLRSDRRVGRDGRAVAGLTRAELVLPEAGRLTVLTIVEALP